MMRSTKINIFTSGKAVFKRRVSASLLGTILLLLFTSVSAEGLFDPPTFGEVLGGFTVCPIRIR